MARPPSTRSVEAHSGTPAPASTGSGMGAQPAIELGRRMGHEARREGLEGRRLVRAEADGDAGRAGIGGELQVVRGVADHQRAGRRDAQLGHQLLQHARMRLGRGLVGGAGGVEQAPMYSALI
eukprot:Opistho-2@59040